MVPRYPALAAALVLAAAALPAPAAATGPDGPAAAPSAAVDLCGTASALLGVDGVDAWWCRVPLDCTGASDLLQDLSPGGLDCRKAR